MKLQVSVDLLSLEQALKLLEEVAPYVDIIEAGTPLIKQEGLRVIEAFKQAYPDKLIFADMKTMDAGGLEADMAFKAGADFTTVLAVANDGTIKGAIASAKKHNRFVTVDMIGVSDRVHRGQEVQQMGADYLEIHCGLDEQAQGLCSLAELQTIRNEISIPLSVAGGINETTIQQVQAAGVEVVAVGGAIYKAASPGEAAKRLKEKIAVAVAV